MNYTSKQKTALQYLLSGNSGPDRIMLFGGSRSGKTFVICCALVLRALRFPGCRQAVLRRHFNTVRTAIGMDTLPKVLRLRFPGCCYNYNKADNCFHFANGSQIWLLGLDEDERSEKILGKEFSAIYFNECSELDYAPVQLALTRLSQKVPGLPLKACFDCNPPGKNHWCYRLFVEKTDPEDNTLLAHPERFAALQMNPADNKENLPADYIERTLSSLPLQQRRRFLEGLWEEAQPDALWSYDLISRHRVIAPPENLSRVVIAVDPAVTYSESSDLTGIAAAGKDTRGHYYVLGDYSIHAPPLVWAKKTVEVANLHHADRVVAEVNNGGELVEQLLRQYAPDLSYRSVRASRGKFIRAEPAAALYELGLVHHVGAFPDLEAEMTGFSPSGSAGGHSPDRLDALVWALAELSNTFTGSRLVTV